MKYYKNENEYKKDILEICRRMYQHGWIAGTDGNVSIRMQNNRILTTPSGVHKGFMELNDLIITDIHGIKQAGRRNPSSEIQMHLTCYQQRTDIGAVVHAHPTYCVAFSIAGKSLAQCLLPEVVATLGCIPTAEYSTPGTQDVSDSILHLIKKFDALILERHGSLTVGDDIFDAYNKLERMEHVAQITSIAHQLGSIQPLTNEQIDQILTINKDRGTSIKLTDDNSSYCNVCTPLNNPSTKEHPKTKLHLNENQVNDVLHHGDCAPTIEKQPTLLDNNALQQIILEEIEKMQAKT